MSTNVVFEENSPDFKKLAKREQHPQKRVRLLAMAMLRNGAKMKETARVLGIERRTVGEWYHRYRKEGLEGLDNRPRSGRSPNLPKNKEKEFIQEVLNLQKRKGGGRVTGNDIQKMALKKFGAAYAEGSIYRVLNRLEISWISSRSQHPKTDPEEQNAFKKTLNRKSLKVYRGEST